MYKRQNIEFETTIPNMFSDDRYNFRFVVIAVLKRRGFFQCVESGWLFYNNQPELGNPRKPSDRTNPPPSIQANLENAHESFKWVI